MRKEIEEICKQISKLQREQKYSHEQASRIVCAAAMAAAISTIRDEVAVDEDDDYEISDDQKAACTF